MEDRIKQKKAFLGAMMAGISLVGGIAGGIAKRKAQKRAMEKQLAEQTRQEGLEQARNMSATYGNQDYVDEFGKKVVFKNGGSTKHYTDRIRHIKKYKCGGRKKANFGASLKTAFNEKNIDGSLTTILNTASSLTNNLMNNGPQQLNAPKNQYSAGEVKTSLEKPSYTVDANGNPITALNTNDRIQVAKLGKRFTKRTR